jgi:hypothetical protein
MPCTNTECLPTLMCADDEECPGSDDETHHCVDCKGLCWDDKGATCSACSEYWCADYQEVFKHSACTHLGDIYTIEESECSFADDIENIQKGVCLQCLLKSKLTCKIKDCHFSRAKLLEDWIQFCQRPIPVELATLRRHATNCIIIAELNRIRPANVEDLWPIDMENVILTIFDRELDKKTLPWSKAIKKAESVVRQKKNDGFTVRQKCFSLRKAKIDRDHSPERK